MQNKKDSIIEAAKDLFSRKGYDAAGVDEIASQAGVTKSLIYYHYKNKKEILDSIIADFFKEYKEILEDSTERGTGKITVYLDYLRKNRKSLNIILTESFKQGENSTAVFRALDTLKECSGDEGAGDRVHWVTEFFTSIVPAMLYVCYEENWCSYFGGSKEELSKEFVQAYQMTHGLYHEYMERESL